MEEAKFDREEMPMFDIHTTALEDRARPEARKMSLGERLSGVAFRVLGLLAPGLPRPRRCRACKTSMELSGDFMFADDDIAKIEAVRFWICSGCGDGIREWYCYPKHLDPLQ